MQHLLKMPCPKCVCEEKDYSSQKWTHAVCGCNLYIDENAIVHCLMCEKSAHISQMRISCDSKRHKRVHCTGKEVAASAAVAHLGIKYNSLIWFKRLLEHL